MNEEYEADLITLIDDDDTTHEFEIVGELDTDEGHFLALEPLDPDASELTEASTYYIFESVFENGEEELVEVYDDELIDKLAPMFESQFEERFYSEDEEEDED
ncbi:MAG: DUF1292 domain-containing protein [Clostridia bacterium]